MKLRTVLVPALFSTALFAGLFAAEAPPAAPAWPQDKSDLKPDSAALFGSLPNGFRYVVLPNKEPPGRMSLRLLVKAGSLMETDNQRGLAHYLEHMAFNGSQHFSAGQMVEYFQRMGLAFGADTNANTSFDRTLYKLDLPATSGNVLRDSLQLLRDDCDGLLLDQKEVDDERGIILSEKRDSDGVDYRTQVANWQFLMPDGLPSKRMPIGEENTIRGANRGEFASFWGKWYTPDRFILIAVGDFKPEELVALIKEYFGSIAPKPIVPNPDMGKFGTPGFLATLHREPEAPAVMVDLTTIAPFQLGPDNASRRQREMALGAANFIVSRRLERVVRQPDSPISQGQAYDFSLFDALQSVGIELTCQPGQWQPAVALAEQQLRRALDYGFTAAEVNEAKAALLNNYEEAVKVAPTRKSRALAEELSAEINTNRVFTHPADDLARMKPAIEALTPEICAAAFRNAWSLSGRRLFISGNLSLNDPANEITSVYTKSASTVLAKEAEAADTAFGYASTAAPGKVAERKEFADLGITQLRFENNVRVNLKHTDFEANRIRVLVQFGGGELDVPASQPAVAFVAEGVFIEGGLGKHSAEELQRILAGKTVGAGFGIGEDFFTFAGATTPRDLRLELELLKAYITDPGYRPESLALARRQFPEFFRRLQTEIEGALADQIEKFPSGGDYRFGYPTQAQAMAVTLADVRAWLAPRLANSYLEISLVGDFDPAAAEAALAATFGTLPSRAEKRADYAAELNVKFVPKGQTKTVTVDSSIPKAVAVVYWPTFDMVSDINGARAMNVLAEIVDDRLRIQLRENLGEVYSPSVGNDPSQVYPHYGFARALIPSDPRQTAALAEKTLAIGDAVASGGVTADEFDRAVTPLRKSLGEYLRQNTYWLNRVVGGSQANPYQLDWARTLPTAYDKITAEQITALAKQYLSSATAARLLILPANPPAPAAAAPAAAK